jgi:hypothetical protein
VPPTAVVLLVPIHARMPHLPGKLKTHFKTRVRMHALAELFPFAELLVSSDAQVKCRRLDAPAFGKANDVVRLPPLPCQASFRPKIFPYHCRESTALAYGTKSSMVPLGLLFA